MKGCSKDKKDGKECGKDGKDKDHSIFFTQLTTGLKHEITIHFPFSDQSCILSLLNC